MGGRDRHFVSRFRGCGTMDEETLVLAVCWDGERGRLFCFKKGSPPIKALLPRSRQCREGRGRGRKGASHLLPRTTVLSRLPSGLRRFHPPRHGEAGKKVRPDMKGGVLPGTGRRRGGAIYFDGHEEFAPGSPISRRAKSSCRRPKISSGRGGGAADCLSRRGRAKHVDGTRLGLFAVGLSGDGCQGRGPLHVHGQTRRSWALVRSDQNPGR